MNKNFLFALPLMWTAAALHADVATGGAYTLERTLLSATQQSSSGGIYTIVGSIGEGFSHVRGDNQAVKCPMKRIYDGFLPPLKTDPNVDAIFSVNNGAVEFTVPAGSLSVPYEVMAETDVVNQSIAADPSTLQLAGQRLTEQIGAYANSPLSTVEVRFLQDDNTIRSGQNNLPASFQMDYDNQVDDILIGHLNEVSQVWDKVSGAQSAASGTSRFTILRSGVYSIFQQGPPASMISTPYAFPVPWRPNHSNWALYGSLQDGITFANLAGSGNIQIFNLEGELVRTLTIPTGAMQMQWNGTTGSGKAVASGVYIWTLDDGGTRRFGKLMVIR
jgi:hypothetical protein